LGPAGGALQLSLLEGPLLPQDEEALRFDQKMRPALLQILGDLGGCIAEDAPLGSGVEGGDVSTKERK
jgi:hypothetical protein